MTAAARIGIATLVAGGLLLTAVGCGDRATAPRDAGADGTEDGSGRDTVSGDGTDGAEDSGPQPDAPADGADGLDLPPGDGPGPDAGQCPSDIQEGGACTTEGQSCGGPCTDPCSFCNLFNCSGGRWQRREVFPAPCFDCGPDLRCVTGEQYCQRVGSDVGGEPDSFSCIDTPESCGGPVTCQCLTDEQVFFSECLEPAPGEVTIVVPGG